MHYDAIQKELEKDPLHELLVRRDPNKQGFQAVLIRVEMGDLTTGETHWTLPDALHSLNQALKEEQEKDA